MNNQIILFEVYNIETKETFYIRNKEQFCIDNNLTRRLLDYTRTGERNHHKKYVLKPKKVRFIESDDGDKYIYNTTTRGYILPIINENGKDDEELMDRELSMANKKIQRLQDQLRITRKINRQHNRESSITDDFIDTVVEILNNKKFNHNVKQHHQKHDSNSSDKTMIIQLSDLHFGKVVDLPNNKFNLYVAKDRLMQYANKIIYYCNSLNIDNVVVCFTGDMTNLDSHMDSLLTNCDNRANNFVSALDIMGEFLDVLYSHIKNIKCVGVVGNESRIRTSEYQSNNDRIASNNFDTLLFKVMKRTHKHITWIGDCDRLNDVVRVQGKNILLTHGDKFKHTSDEILKLKYRMMEQIGDKIDYTIFGHIHSTLITPNYSRSGSIVASDDYSSNALNIPESKASQNIYLVGDEITAIEIKLK